MATKTYMVQLPTGMSSITGDLYPENSETATVTGLTFSEGATAKGFFTASDTTAISSGRYRLVIKESGEVIGNGVRYLTDTAAIFLFGEDQINVDSGGRIWSDLRAILATTLTETVAGYLSAAFKKWFDVASPTGTVNSIPDAVPGAAGGLLRVGTNTGATTSFSALTVTGSTTLAGVSLTTLTITSTVQLNGTLTVVGHVALADGIAVTCSAANRPALSLSGSGTGHGIIVTGGATGNGILARGGATSGDGIRSQGTAGNGNGMTLVAHGTGLDFNASTSALTVSAVSGAVGSVTGNVGGNVVGSVGSVTGDVGGNVVGNVGGSVGSIDGVTFPANFSALAIDASGHVILQDASLVTAKLGTFVLAKTTNISGFNDLSAAQVNAEADAALADYDGPTNAEMNARTLAAADYATAANQTIIIGYVDELESRLTATRAGYLDKLNITGNVASSGEVTAIQNNTRVVVVVPDLITGATTYLVHLYLYDSAGNMEAPDSAPTVALANQAGTDRSARLDSTTGTFVATGHYVWEYTANDDTPEQLLWEFSVVEGGATRLIGRTSNVVAEASSGFTTDDRSKLVDIFDMLPSSAFLAGTNNATGAIEMDQATGNYGGSVASVAGSVGSVTGSVGGSVASVVGNVGGNVVGSVASVTGNVGGNVVGNVNGSVGSVAGDIGGNLTGSVGSLSGTAKSEVNTELTSVLNAAVPASPTVNSVFERLKALDDNYTATRAGYLDNVNNSNLTNVPSFPPNFADLAITATTGRVNVSTNYDKASYLIDGTINTLDALDTAQDLQHAATQAAVSDLAATVGIAGAGLTDLPWNVDWDALVQAAAEAALATYTAPTLAQFNARTLAAADYATDAALATVHTITSEIKARTDLIPNSPAAVGSAMTLEAGAINNDAFGVPAEGTAAAMGFLDKIGWAIGRLGFRRVRRNKVANTLDVYKQDATTVWTTSSYSSSDTVDDIGAAS